MGLPSAVASVETIDAAKSGRRDALEAIFRAYQPALIRYLGTRAPDLAADVASQTWVSVAESITRFDGDGHALRGWIITIGRRRLADELRRRGRRMEDPGELPAVADDTTTEDLVFGGADWARGMLRQLPPQQADIVMLRVIGGLSVDEVAAETGLTPGNVRVQCHRGLSRLRELVAAGDDPEHLPSEHDLAVTEATARAM